MATAKKSVVVATPFEVAVESRDASAILAAAEERFTVGSALTASESAEAATAYASDALAAWEAGEEVGGRLVQRMTVRAAYAAYAAVKAGILADGPRPKDAADSVRDAKAWGEAWITPAKPEGVKRNTVDMWIRAGEAFVEWGVDPDSSEGRRLLGGLSQSKEWNAERKVLREAIAELSEAEDVDPVKVAEFATAKIAEVRAEVERIAAEREEERKAEAKRKAEETRAALTSKTVDTVKAPESLADRIVVAEQIIAGLRPAIKAEREALEELAARIAVALAQHAEDVA